MCRSAPLGIFTSQAYNVSGLGLAASRSRLARCSAAVSVGVAAEFGADFALGLPCACADAVQISAARRNGRAGRRAERKSFIFNPVDRLFGAKNLAAKSFVRAGCDIDAASWASIPVRVPGMTRKRRQQDFMC